MREIEEQQKLERLKERENIETLKKMKKKEKEVLKIKYIENGKLAKLSEKNKEKLAEIVNEDIIKTVKESKKELVEININEIIEKNFKGYFFQIAKNYALFYLKSLGYLFFTYNNKLIICNNKEIEHEQFEILKTKYIEQTKFKTTCFKLKTSLEVVVSISLICTMFF